MSKVAFIFPGQGAQYVGMGKEIASSYSSSKRVFEEASDKIGLDLSKMVFDGDEENLKITENTQPAILTASIACLSPILERGIKPDFVAGLSLGEYTAHVASGTFSFADAVFVVKKRGKFMQEAVPEGVGTMAAILGLSQEQVIESCNEASRAGIVEPANFNCPGQVVIAGEVGAIELAIQIAKEKGAKRAMTLAVSAPFHCSMLKPAGEKLKEALEDVSLKAMQIPLVSNVDGELIQDQGGVYERLIKQVSQSVLWEKSVMTLLDQGVDTFLEVGPGKVLTGFVKKISKEVTTLNVENLETLHHALKTLDAKRCI